MLVLSQSCSYQNRFTNPKNLLLTVDHYGMLIPMISLKKLIALARRWKKMAVIGRRTISLPRINGKLARAGHFRRFVVRLAYLYTNIFRELLRLSKEEFGLPRDGPITLPCYAAVLEYVISLIQRHVSEKLEQALFVLLASHQATMKNQLL
ncbi:Small auxin-up RNA - like 10, partial [Theobroma cacao]